jgi:hypothetical protein
MVEVNWTKDGSPTGNQRISVANSGESFGKDGIGNRKVHMPDKNKQKPGEQQKEAD